MQIRRFARWVGSLALILGVTACVVHDTPPVNPGYGYYGPQSYGPGYGPPPGGYGQGYSSEEAPGNGAVGGARATPVRVQARRGVDARAAGAAVGTGRRVVQPAGLLGLGLCNAEGTGDEIGVHPTFAVGMINPWRVMRGVNPCGGCITRFLVPAAGRRRHAAPAPATPA